MRSRLVVVACVAAVLVLAVGTAALGEKAPSGKPSTVIGFGFPTFGTLNYESGYIKSETGFNIGLGYSARYFTADGGLQPGRFNFYWGWGTIILLLPYVEFGWTYPFELANGEQLLNLTIGFLYIIPHLELSICF